MKLYVKAIIFLTICFLFFSCTTNSEKVFYIPTVGILRQANIAQIEKKHNIYFDQYEGFYINSQKSFFNKLYLIIKKQERIDSHKLPSKEINNLKSSSVEKIFFQYGLNSTKSRDSVYNIIKNLFKGYSFKESSSKMEIMDLCGSTFCKVEYHDFAIPNFIVEIYPTIIECLSLTEEQNKL